MATTKLGNALAGKAQPASVSRLQAAIGAAFVCEPFTIPGINVPCLMTMVGTERMLDLDGESRLAMEARKVALDYITADKYELQYAQFVLQESCREVDKSGKPGDPIGTRAEWGLLSAEIIAACWLAYNEMRSRLDPLADDASVSTTEILQVKDAIKKKDGRALRSFGLQKLTAYLLTTADPPSSSPTPKSEDGDSYPDASNGEEHPPVDAAT